MKQVEEIYRLFLQLYNELHKTQLGLKEAQSLLLTTSEDHYLGIIYDLGTPTFTAFANAANISKPAATKCIKGFIKKGYVTKIQSSSDRRSYTLQVSEAVQSYFSSIDKAFTSILVERVQEISEEELMIFTKVLLKMLHKKEGDLTLQECS